MMIISGGQVGVDRAALDAGIERGWIDLEFMGWCPAGRRAIDGTVPETYVMREHQSSAYPPRTLENIRSADATLVLGWGAPSGGTALTLRYCREEGVPWSFIDLKVQSPKAPYNVARWIVGNMVWRLNVAGPGRDEVYEPARTFILKVIDEWERLP